MLNKENVRYTTEKTVNVIRCWLCQDLIDPKDNPEHLVLDMDKHPLVYRTHSTCFYELFGDFCLFAYATLHTGDVIQTMAA